MSLGKTGLQLMRCQHKCDYEQHKRCMCEEPRNCECLNECGCREYIIPSLTWSKVRVVWCCTCSGGRRTTPSSPSMLT